MANRTMALVTGAYVCGWCDTKVERKVVFQGSPYWLSAGTGLAGQHNQEILRCVACDKLTYDVPTDDDAPQWPRPDTTLSLTMEVLPEDVVRVWKEVLTCWQAEAPMATAAMLRTLIIAVWRDQNKDKKKAPNFLPALNDLEKSDLLNKPLRDRADRLRVLANDAVHEIKPPDEQGLEAAMKTANLWLRVMYEDVPKD